MAYVVALLGGVVLWGVAWWPIQVLNEGGLEAVPLSLAANGTAALVLLYPALQQRAKLWGARRVLLAIAIVGGCWNLAFVAAMAEGEAGRRILLYYLSSSWSIIGARVFLGESVDARRWVSVLLAFGGAVAVVGLGHADPTGLSLGDGLAIVAGLGHAATNLLFRYAEEVPLCCKNGALFGGSTIGAGAILAWLGPPALPGPSGGLWLCAAILGAAWVLLADSLVQYGVSHLPAARSSVLMLAELPVTMVSAALIAGEPISGTEMAGAALIAGAALNELWQANRADQAAVPIPRAPRLTPV